MNGFYCKSEFCNLRLSSVYRPPWIRVKPDIVGAADREQEIFYFYKNYSMAWELPVK